MEDDNQRRWGSVDSQVQSKHTKNQLTGGRVDVLPAKTTNIIDNCTFTRNESLESLGSQFDNKALHSGRSVLLNTE